jgi:Patatin-like phospholipase
MDNPKPSPKWIDLQAVLTEELACIKEGRVEPELQDKSEEESARRAKASAAPSGKFFAGLFQSDLWGLCLSGGGIRSATFALGLIQSLAAVRLLPRFHYLSTVSGGGYIGSWLSSWAHRHPEGIDGVVGDLNQPPEGKKIEADPLWYLRSYTSYLNPRLGILSADTWTLVATYLRNLLLNCLVLLPLLWAVVLTPKIGLAMVRLLPGDSVTGWLTNHRFESAVAALIAGSVCLIIGMTYVFAALVQKLAEASRDAAGSRKKKGQREFLIRCLLPIMVAALLLPLAWAWNPEYPPSDREVPWWWFLCAGVALRFVAWGLSFVMAKLGGHRKERTWLADAQFALASLATGALGGVLVWWLLTTFFSDIAGFVGEPATMQARGAIEIALYVCFAPPLMLLAMLTTEAVFVGLVSRQTDDEDREWWGRSGGWLVIASLFWMGLRVLAVFGPLVIHWLEAQAPVIVTALGGISGFITAALGFGTGTPGTTGKQAPKTLGGFLQGSALILSAAVFVCALLAGLALAGDWILHYVAPGSGDIGLDCTDTKIEAWLAHCGMPAAMLAQSVGLYWTAAAIFALLIFAWFMQHFVSVNRFSLHAMYRARLIRAYLGASNTDRNPNWFTGFDPADNLVMADIKAGGTKRPRKPGESSMPPRYPFHILNTALNLVHGENLAWQQRKAASMTISPLHAGNRDQGYRRSRNYGHPKGISLGTALTISGAAASPNMGYHSSPIVGLVMTLFNLRLGAWLGNPGQPAGDKTFYSEGPRLSARSLMYEALGLTDSKKPYVYLTDGGHFENLGLYELVQRRCRLIVVSDAGCDPAFEFEDLGNAIRKIRIDLGIDILMDEIEMHPRSSVDEHGVEPIEPGLYFATGTIRYPELREVNGKDEQLEGRLIYIKPGIYGKEPRDVLNYAATHPDFPHESTADQWFDEAQFESYRQLGEYVGKCLSGDLNENATIDEIVAAAQTVPVKESASVGPAAPTTRPVDPPSPVKSTNIHRRPPKPWYRRAG